MRLLIGRDHVLVGDSFNSHYGRAIDSNVIGSKCSKIERLYSDENLTNDVFCGSSVEPIKMVMFSAPSYQKCLVLQ